MLRNIPSCGLSLLCAPVEAHDYVLKLTDDDKHYVHINCHRCVLLAHSKKMRELMTGENYFSMIIRLQTGYIGACVELLQYMYLRDLSLITEKDKVLKMCSLFDMPFEFVLLKNDKNQKLNITEPIPIIFDKTEFVVGRELLDRMVFYKQSDVQ